MYQNFLDFLVFKKVKSTISLTDKKAILTYGVMLSFVAIAATLFLSAPVTTLASLIGDEVTVTLQGYNGTDKTQTNTTTAGTGHEFNYTVQNTTMFCKDGFIEIDIEESVINITLVKIDGGEFTFCNLDKDIIGNPLIFNFTDLNWLPVDGVITEILNITDPTPLNETHAVAGDHAVDITINATEFAGMPGLSLEFLYELITEHAFFDGNKTWTFTNYNLTNICRDTFDEVDDQCEDGGGNAVPFGPPNIFLDDGVFPDTLPLDEEGNYQLNGTTKKGTKFANTNPGAFYAVTTVQMTTDVDSLKITEDYSDCTDPGFIKLLSSPVNQFTAAKAFHVTPDGNVTDISHRLTNPSDLGVRLDDISATNANVTIIDVGLLTDGSTIQLAIKFQHDVAKNSPVSTFDGGQLCENFELVNATTADGAFAFSNFTAVLNMTLP